MGSLSDTMLGSGTGILIPVLHGELVTVLSGLDIGKTFTAVIEVEHDLTLSGDGVGMDRRAKRVIRFFAGVPRMTGQTQIQDSDGNKWRLIDDPQNGYLSTDFELEAIVPGIDT